MNANCRRALVTRQGNSSRRVLPVREAGVMGAPLWSHLLLFSFSLFDVVVLGSVGFIICFSYFGGVFKLVVWEDSLCFHALSVPNSMLFPVGTLLDRVG